ncbi:MAG: hypothetical protein E7388_08495 [Ruminococcaceae bacterium]|nr:hypothetical protein [Oscillospiraceae bacterium]
MNKIFKPGDTVLFMGDSITDCGRGFVGNDFGYGYAYKVREMYNELFSDDNLQGPQTESYPPIKADAGVNFVNRGIGGNHLIDVLARYESDIKAVNPDFMSILIGANEVLHYYTEGRELVTGEVFEEQYERLMQQFRKDFPKAKLMIMEPFFIPTLKEEHYKLCMGTLAPEILVVRKMAAKYADYFLPLGSIFTKALMEYKPVEIARDGIHPTPIGHGIIAYEFMKALGIL